jgi:hypothetical protein
MSKHITMRGERIDFNALIEQHATVPAVGNANMNARGDRLGKNGVILKTQEQVEAEWAAAQSTIDNSVAVDIKTVIGGKPVDTSDQHFDAVEPIAPAAPAVEATPAAAPAATAPDEVEDAAPTGEESLTGVKSKRRIIESNV